MKSEACFVGVDWGGSEHLVAIYRPSTGQNQVFKVPHTAEGLKLLVEKLRAAAPVAGVAVEGRPELLMCALMQAACCVYSINPKLSAAWREAQSVAGVKSDAGDAARLAHQLSVHYRGLRPERVESDQIQVLARLCEDEQGLIKRRTALVQELEAVLKQYYPAGLACFEDWTSPTAWDFVLAYPTPGRLATASKAKLCRFLAAHRIGMSPLWQRRVEHRAEAAQWPCIGPAESACALRAQCLARELKAVAINLRSYRKEIEALFEQHPDAGLFTSLPGAGPKLAPRLLAMMGEDRQRYEDAGGVQGLSGVAPVTVTSGNMRKVRFRRACKKRWRDTLYLFARTSQFRCAWARAFYLQCRERGDRDPTALRKLGYKWLKILFRMWQEKKPYDDIRYLQSLKKHGSPLIPYMKSHHKPVRKTVEKCA